MTGKESKFVKEFLKDNNATQAAIRAGYSEKTAYSIGSENLKKPEIEAAIQAERQKHAQKAEVTVEMLIAELKTIGFSSVGEFFHDGWEAKDVSELTEAQKKAIASVKKTKVRFGSEGEGERESFEFRLHSKLDAIEKLAKHLGFYEKDNSQTRPFNVVVASQEEAKKLSDI